MGDHQTGYSKLAHSSIPRVRTGASGYRAQLTSSFQSLTPSRGLKANRTRTYAKYIF